MYAISDKLASSLYSVFIVSHAEDSPLNNCRRTPNATMHSPETASKHMGPGKGVEEVQAVGGKQCLRLKLRVRRPTIHASTLHARMPDVLQGFVAG